MTFIKNTDTKLKMFCVIFIDERYKYFFFRITVLKLTNNFKQMSIEKGIKRLQSVLAHMQCRECF